MTTTTCLACHRAGRPCPRHEAAARLHVEGDHVRLHVDLVLTPGAAEALIALCEAQGWTPDVYGSLAVIRDLERRTGRVLGPPAPAPTTTPR